MRSLLLLAVALVATVGAVGAVVLLFGEDGPRELLPDLRQLPPDAISVDEAEGEHRLVFLSAVDNVGDAALVIEGRRASRAEPTMTVEQVVRRADGSDGRRLTDDAFEEATQAFAPRPRAAP